MAKCTLLVGRLVSHPCSAKSAGHCTKCGGSFCARHLTVRVCVLCAGTYQVPPAPVRLTFEEMFAFDDGDFETFDQASHGSTDIVTAADS
jgi:hypothetical protein